MRNTHNLKKSSSWFWRLLSKSADLSKPLKPIHWVKVLHNDPFFKEWQLMSALLGWKGLVRMIPFLKNEDRAELFTRRMDFSSRFVLFCSFWRLFTIKIIKSVKVFPFSFWKIITFFFLLYTNQTPGPPCINKQNGSQVI